MLGLFPSSTAGGGGHSPSGAPNAGLVRASRALLQADRQLHPLCPWPGPPLPGTYRTQLRPHGWIRAVAFQAQEGSG